MIVQGKRSLPRQEWKRPWGTLQAWTCASGYRLVKAAVKTVPKVMLVGFGDLHYGSPHCDMETATAVRDWIRRERALWVGMGDFIECATRDSVGAGVYEQIRDPDEQIEDVENFFAPISDLCLGLIKGNHEERAHKMVGIDPMAIIARELGVPYCGWELWAVISRVPVAARAWTVYAVHSSAGNKSGGLGLAWTDREIRRYAGVDIIMRAHTHSKGFDPVSSLVLNSTGRNPAVEEQERYLVTTGHFLRRAGSYAAGKAMAPKPSGAVALRLSVNRGSVSLAQPVYLPETA